MRLRSTSYFFLQNSILAAQIGMRYMLLNIESLAGNYYLLRNSPPISDAISPDRNVFTMILAKSLLLIRVRQGSCATHAAVFHNQHISFAHSPQNLP